VNSKGGREVRGPNAANAADRQRTTRQDSAQRMQPPAPKTDLDRRPRQQQLVPVGAGRRAVHVEVQGRGGGDDLAQRDAVQRLEGGLSGALGRRLGVYVFGCVSVRVRATLRSPCILSCSRASARPQPCARTIRHHRQHSTTSSEQRADCRAHLGAVRGGLQDVLEDVHHPDLARGAVCRLRPNAIAVLGSSRGVRSWMIGLRQLTLAANVQCSRAAHPRPATRRRAAATHSLPASSLVRQATSFQARAIALSIAKRVGWFQTRRARLDHHF